MKSPEYLRAYPPQAPETPPAENREEKVVPRYVQAPALRDHGMGPRNLFWGVVVLFLAFLLLVVGVFMVGAKAMVYVAACLLTFTALFVLSRLHVFRQRNGGFFALAVVCLIGTAFPLVEKGYSTAKTLAALRPAVPNAPTVALHSQEQGPPLLIQSFALPEPQGDAKQVKVVRDTQVVIAGKPFLIKAGDRFPLIASKGDQTTFAVRDLLLSLPTTETEVLDPSALAKGVGINTASPLTQASSPGATAAKANADGKNDEALAEVTRKSQQEAMRRYPALAVKDSLENAVFISTYKQLREANSDEFFADPKWPMVLADMLAKREGWIVGGAPMTTGPAPVLDAPTDSPAPAPNSTLLPDNAPVDNTPADATPADLVPTPTPVAPAPRAQPVRRAPVALPSIDSLDAGGGLPRAGGH
ncbi:MAG TPA: hypothetical protein VGM54_20435 [Chthoniobacter sp.]